MVLRIFQHFGSRPGEVLRGDNLTGFSTRHGWSAAEIAEGLEHGVDLGWFDYAPDEAARLTKAGYAEIASAAPPPSPPEQPGAWRNWTGPRRPKLG